MHLPSLDRLLASARATLVRFPPVLAAAGLATVGALLLIDLPDNSICTRLIVVGTLGLPLFFALTLYAERRGWSAPGRIGFGLVGVVVLAAVFFAWSHWLDPVAWRRYAQLSLTFHLLVAFLPFAGRGELNGFWQYNRSLLLRFLTAALYSGVLYLGLALALGALDKLLGVHISGDTYLRLWVVVAFLFNTWFFLAGVPVDLSALEARPDYPAGLKVFTQYVLVPLVSVYLAILTIYMVKILVTRQWPSGWIGYLVSSVAVAGILSMLLVHPIRDREGNRWIRTYSRWFYIALAPSIVMLLMAIWLRIVQYGVTENRYFLTVGALWLAGIAAYYTATGSGNIERIPQSLCAVALITLLGPWSAYAVAERSQASRLHDLLDRNGMLVDGHARPAPEPVAYGDRREISAVLRYLLETHGSEAIAPWFDGKLAEIETAPTDSTRPGPGNRADAQARVIMTYLGLGYINRWAARRPDRFFYSAKRSLDARRVAGYEYAVHLVASDARREIAFGDRALELRSDSVALRFLEGGVAIIEVPFEPLLARIESASDTSGITTNGPVFTRSLMGVQAENARIRVALDFDQISGRRTPSGHRVANWAADVYLTLR